MAKKTILFVCFILILTSTGVIFSRFFKQADRQNNSWQINNSTDKKIKLNGLHIRLPAGWKTINETPTSQILLSQTSRQITLTLQSEVTLSATDVISKNTQKATKSAIIREEPIQHLLISPIPVENKNPNKKALSGTIYIYQDQQLSAEITHQQIRFTIAYKTSNPLPTDQETFRSLISQISLYPSEYPIHVETAGSPCIKYTTEELECAIINQYPQAQKVAFYILETNNTQVLQIKNITDIDPFKLSWQKKELSDKKEIKDLQIFAEVLEPEKLTIIPLIAN